ncbi:MAG: hypothetical protein VB137_05925 [Burkholderia sp.]
MPKEIAQLASAQLKFVAQLADRQIPDTIGRVVLAIIEQQETLSIKTLIAALERSINSLPDQEVKRRFHEAALKALQDAWNESS